jgi:hypothetical protein
LGRGSAFRYGSSEEIVGGIGFGQFAKRVIEGESSGNGHPTPATCAANMYSWTVLWEIEQLWAI